jgi:uracil-DNA glycosylase
MNMTREDILRELELLPVWKLRKIPVAQTTEASKPDVDVKIVPQVNTVDSAESLVTEPIVPIIGTQIPAVQRITKQWAFICDISSTQEDGCAMLMRNIIKATHLESIDYVLLNESQALKNYLVGDILFFGLDMANQYLNTNEIDLSSLRGKYHLVENVRCWVTYHPQQMLQDPLLKREVWRDICAAMPRLAK